MTDLWRLTATEAVGKLRKRELSLLEMVEAAAARIEIIEPKVNALPIRVAFERDKLAVSSANCGTVERTSRLIPSVMWRAWLG